MAIGDRIHDFRGRYGFLNIPMFVARRKNSELSAGAKLLYGVMAEDWATTPRGKDSECEKPVDELAKEIGFSPRQTQRFIAELKRTRLVGVITQRYVQGETPQPNKYFPKEHEWEDFYQKTPQESEDADGTRAEDADGTRAEDADGAHDSKSIINQEQKHEKGRQNTIGVKKHVGDSDDLCGNSVDDQVFGSEKLVPSQEQADLLNFKDGDEPADMFLRKYHDLCPHRDPFVKIRGNLKEIRDVRSRIDNTIRKVGGIDQAVKYLHDVFNPTPERDPPRSVLQALYYISSDLKKSEKKRVADSWKDYKEPQ